jgi:STE24 endopeptidase
LIFLIWLAWSTQGNPLRTPQTGNLALFFGLFAFMILMLGAWSRLLAARVRRVHLDNAVGYFNRVAFCARFFVPIWFGLGTFMLGWGEMVQILLGPIGRWPVEFPGALIGTLPALGAWAGLWWAQYPADQAIREQSLLVRLDNNLTLFRPPTLRAYLLQNLRLQILFTGIPILLILLLRDAVIVTLWRGFDVNVWRSAVEGGVTLGSAIVVFVLVPQLLVRILPTEPLPDSPLRSRMLAMCAAHRVKFRQILLWRTEHRVANALVMGILPRLRYVLLSDLLLEEMSDDQVEAVFAHELGHAVHRHLIWYVVFLKVLIVALAGVTLLLGELYIGRWIPAWMPQDLLMTLFAFGAFVVAFGYVSRRFERQADVFAARTLEQIANEGQSHVGPHGAGVFSSALRKVAAINNMPLSPRGPWRGGPRERLVYLLELVGDATGNWLHGSIPHRMQTLEEMSLDPRRTRYFDRRMRRLYLLLFLGLLASVAVAWRFGMPA